MQEDYLLEKMIKGKTDKEKELELMQTIIETKELLKNAKRKGIELDRINELKVRLYGRNNIAV